MKLHTRLSAFVALAVALPRKAYAVGTKSNFVLYDAQFRTGYNETLAQNTQAFNEPSRNALRYMSDPIPGEIEKMSFFSAETDLISNRDVTAVGQVADQPMNMGEMSSPIVNRGYGPRSVTGDAFDKIGADPGLFSMLLGQQVAVAQLVDHLSIACIVLKAALTKDSATFSDRTAETTSGVKTKDLTAGLRKMGDAAPNIVCWVMTGQSYYDLLDSQFGEGAALFQVADMAVREGTAASLGRPIVVIDQAQLSDSPDVTNVGALTAGINAAATAIELAANATQAVAVGDYLVILAEGANTTEVVRVTAVTSQSEFTVARAQQGTEASAHAANAVVQLQTTGDIQWVLGLTTDALIVTESSIPRMEVDTITGHANLFTRIQGEYTVRPRMKGWQWGGGTGPDNAALGTAANWAQAVQSPKNGPGFIIKCDL